MKLVEEAKLTRRYTTVYNGPCCIKEFTFQQSLLGFVK